MKTIRILLLIPYLLATTCAVKEANFQIVNTTDEKYYITYTKDINLINKFIKKDYAYDDSIMKIESEFSYPFFIEPSINFYSTKDKKKCKFYIVKQSDLKSTHPKFYILYVPIKKIKFGNDNGLIQIIIEKDSIYYKSW